MTVKCHQMLKGHSLAKGYDAPMLESRDPARAGMPKSFSFSFRDERRSLSDRDTKRYVLEIEPVNASFDCTAAICTQYTDVGTPALYTSWLVPENGQTDTALQVLARSSFPSGAEVLEAYEQGETLVMREVELPSQPEGYSWQMTDGQRKLLGQFLALYWLELSRSKPASGKADNRLYLLLKEPGASSPLVNEDAVQFFAREIVSRLPLEAQSMVSAVFGIKNNEAQLHFRKAVCVILSGDENLPQFKAIDLFQGGQDLLKRIPGRYDREALKVISYYMLLPQDSYPEWYLRLRSLPGGIPKTLAPQLLYLCHMLKLLNDGNAQVSDPIFYYKKCYQGIYEKLLEGGTDEKDIRQVLQPLAASIAGMELTFQLEKCKQIERAGEQLSIQELHCLAKPLIEAGNDPTCAAAAKDALHILRSNYTYWIAHEPACFPEDSRFLALAKEWLQNGLRSTEYSGSSQIRQMDQNITAVLSAYGVTVQEQDQLLSGLRRIYALAALKETEDNPELDEQQKVRIISELHASLSRMGGIMEGGDLFNAKRTLSSNQGSEALSASIRRKLGFAVLREIEEDTHLSETEKAIKIAGLHRQARDMGGVLQEDDVLSREFLSAMKAYFLAWSQADKPFCTGADLQYEDDWFTDVMKAWSTEYADEKFSLLSAEEAERLVLAVRTALDAYHVSPGERESLLLPFLKAKFSTELTEVLRGTQMRPSDTALSLASIHARCKKEGILPHQAEELYTRLHEAMLPLFSSWAEASCPFASDKDGRYEDDWFPDLTLDWLRREAPGLAMGADQMEVFLDKLSEAFTKYGYTYAQAEQALSSLRLQWCKTKLKEIQTGIATENPAEQALLLAEIHARLVQLSKEGAEPPAGFEKDLRLAMRDAFPAWSEAPRPFASGRSLRYEDKPFFVETARDWLNRCDGSSLSTADQAEKLLERLGSVLTQYEVPQEEQGDMLSGLRRLWGYLRLAELQEDTTLTNTEKALKVADIHSKLRNDPGVLQEDDSLSQELEGTMRELFLDWGKAPLPFASGEALHYEDDWFIHVAQQWLQKDFPLNRTKLNAVQLEKLENQLEKCSIRAYNISNEQLSKWLFPLQQRWGEAKLEEILSDSQINGSEKAMKIAELHSLLQRNPELLSSNDMLSLKLENAMLDAFVSWADTPRPFTGGEDLTRQNDWFPLLLNRWCTERMDSTRWTPEAFAALLQKIEDKASGCKIEGWNQLQAKMREKYAAVLLADSAGRQLPSEDALRQIAQLLPSEAISTANQEELKFILLEGALESFLKHAKEPETLPNNWNRRCAESYGYTWDELADCPFFAKSLSGWMKQIWESLDHPRERAAFLFGLQKLAAQGGNALAASLAEEWLFRLIRENYQDLAEDSRVREELEPVIQFLSSRGHDLSPVQKSKLYRAGAYRRSYEKLLTDWNRTEAIALLQSRTDLSGYQMPELSSPGKCIQTEAWLLLELLREQPMARSNEYWEAILQAMGTPTLDQINHMDLKEIAATPFLETIQWCYDTLPKEEKERLSGELKQCIKFRAPSFWRSMHQVFPSGIKKLVKGGWKGLSDDFAQWLRDE